MWGSRTWAFRPGVTLPGGGTAGVTLAESAFRSTPVPRWPWAGTLIDRLGAFAAHEDAAGALFTGPGGVPHGLPPQSVTRRRESAQRKECAIAPPPVWMPPIGR